jgi:hypothetical protein
MTKASRAALDAAQALAGIDLDEATDEQVWAEFVEDGRDPAQEARLVAERLDAVVASFMRERASSAKKLRAASSIPTVAQRPGIERIRQLIRAAFDSEPELAAAFRQGTKQSDQDIISVYDDLVSMGKIGAERQ